MTTRLIINADDYGRTSDISRGIRYAHLNGLVTSTTCMMNMPNAVEDIHVALEQTPNLGLGVHLVLTSGKPLLAAEKVSELIYPDGSFLRLEKLIQKANRLDLGAVKAEWRAQIDAFIFTTSKKPTHIDSHHHSSYFTPGLIKTMLELAKEYNLPIRLPLAHGHDPYTSGIPEEFLEAIVEEGPRILEKFQPRSPDAFFASFYDNQATRAEFLHLLRLFFPNGCFEIMCHPGYVNESFAFESSYSYQRQTELEILTDPILRKEVERLGIELISFASL